MVIRGANGEREVGSDDFFSGFLETAVSETELLTEIRVPKAAGAGFSFQKFNRRAQDWAIVGAAVQLNGDSVGVGLVNMDSKPIRASGVEAAVSGGADPAAAAEVAAEGCEPPADLNASVEYRQHLARVLVRRGLEAATA
jgi:carbon-monoxide dehydrogenase medium subunit